MTPEDYGKWTVRYDGNGTHYIPGHTNIAKAKDAAEIHLLHGEPKYSLKEKLIRGYCEFTGDYVNKR